MLKKNVGTIDRTLRILLGAALLIAFYFYRDTGLSWLFLIGVIPLATGLTGSCPLYSIFGFSTCPLKQ